MTAATFFKSLSQTMIIVFSSLNCFDDLYSLVFKFSLPVRFQFPIS